VSATRRFRLVRATTLSAWRRSIVEASLEGGLAGIRATTVLVPTRASAGQLRLTLEDAALQSEHAAIVLPDVLTRAEFYEDLRTTLPEPTLLASVFERDAMLLASAHEAITNGLTPPFDLRPALIDDMIELYDELRRRQQTVERFERLLSDELEPSAASDRGAERMLRQTRFLASAFRAYEARLAAAGLADEHVLRDRLGSARPAGRHRHVVTTLADRGLDPNGLWPADFDLLSRLDGIETLTVVATEEQLAAGWMERVHDLLPEIEEVRAIEDPASLETRTLAVPQEGSTLYFTCRDREEEVARVVRDIKRRRTREADVGRLDRTAVVFARPLPYLYLARTIFESARLPFQCEDALPLAAEPAAAALDLVLDVAASGASRPAIVNLLRSPHFALGPERTPVSQDSVQALDEALAAARFRGGPDGLRDLVASWKETPAAADVRATSLRRRAMSAAEAALAAVTGLKPLFGDAAASAHLETLRAFLAAATLDSQRSDPDMHLLPGREARAWAAIHATLEGLASAYRQHGDLVWTVDELSATLRRWLESQTFTPCDGATGVHLVDADAAPYGGFDDVYLVGLVEGEWPDRSRRNLFYSPLLLKELGWADDRLRASWSRAAFADLLRLAARETSVSTFQLEEDSLVEPSALVEDVARAGLTPVPQPPDSTLVLLTDALVEGRLSPGALGGAADRWLGLRLARSPSGRADFHGVARPHRPAVHGVSGLELYVQCPFKYYARYVLRLAEEVEDEDGLGPRDRGTFIHSVFQAFYEQWSAAGGATITPATIGRARGIFEEVVQSMVSRLSPADAALERTRLLGSPVAPGVAELVFSAEAVGRTAVIERRLEDRFEGTYELVGPDGARQASIRGIVDRIDLLADGSLRVIDYKSSLPLRPVQLAVYAVTTQQRLKGYRGREWRLGEVSYIAFGNKREVKTIARGAEQAAALADAQRRTVEAIQGIEQGMFPPRPVQTRLCATCAYAMVCRRDHVVESEQSSQVSPL
jgi:RecB family exonuclease